MQSKKDLSERDICTKYITPALEKAGWSNPDTASAYARDFAHAADFCVPVFTKLMQAGPGRRLLDLCSGHGNVAKGLSRAGAEVIGLDFSPAMIALAKANVPNAEFLEGDAGNLPFESGRFDGVTMGFGMPHVPEPARVIAEARRVLKPGGTFAFSVWCGNEVDGAFSWVFDAIAACGAPDIALPEGPGANDYADPNRAFPALIDAGFRDPAITEIDNLWQSDNPAAPFDYFLEGTVRGGALLKKQPTANAEAIRNAVKEKVVQNLGSNGPWTIPIPSVIVSATAA